jgi:hypothetical protein
MSENTTTPARYVAAEASFTEPTTGERVESNWGVHDTVENAFAPFGGTEELASFAAQRVEEKPWLPWFFIPAADFTLAASAPRFEWIEATWQDDGGEPDTCYGVVDRELGRFAPFALPDELAEDVVASVAANPDAYEYADTFTPTN